MSRLFCWLGGGTALAVAVSACRPEAPAGSARPESAPPPVLHQGPLTDFVPSAGLRWLISGSPAYFADEPALQAAFSRLFTSERLDAFAASSGVELRRTERAALAAFDLGELYLVDARGWVSPPELRFAERAAGTARSERPHPELWRVSGLIASKPQVMVRVANTLAAFAVGDPTLARVVEAYALGRLERTPSALHGAALSTLPEELLEPAPLAFYALGPFKGEWASAASGLLSGALALALTLELEPARALVAAPEGVEPGEPLGPALRARLVVSGAWDAQSSPGRLEGAWQELAESELGRLLAFNRPAGTPVAEATPNLLRLSVSLRLEPLAAGLYAAVAGSVSELLNLPLESREPPAGVTH